MTGDLLWPGDHRAGTIFSATAFGSALVAVEAAWLRVLTEAGLAPSGSGARLVGLDLTPSELDEVADAAEGSGNPVVPLLGVLRRRLLADDARWLHRGLTSQDVLDTALLLCARDALDQLVEDLRRVVVALVGLAELHRDTAMVGRTLTQHAVPITFGLKVAGWLQGVVDATAAVRRVRHALPVQCGGAAGSLSAVVELARAAGETDPEQAALRWSDRLAAHLDLQPSPPWHTRRTPVSTLGDALVQVTDALGHLAGDVAVLSRTEIAEVAEPSGAGRGGSSTMPQKQNPVLAVLIGRAAAAAPLLGAQLHLAAAQAVDERPAGPWHTEWQELAVLSRHTVVAASQAAELCSGLHVDARAMSRTLAGAAPGVVAEQRSIRDLVGATAGEQDPAGYLGACGLLVDGAVRAARTSLEETG